MIIKILGSYEKPLVEFLYKYNNKKSYKVAWVPENYSEIVSYDKSSFILCIENNEIVGCLGAYISEEQGLARLLGPIIKKEYFEKYADEVYTYFLRNLPMVIKELRIAFPMENELCKSWCIKKGFDLYNAEVTMIYKKEVTLGEEKESSVNLIPYDEKYKAGLSLVHPKETFFTLDELVNQINNNHHLILSIDKEEVTGYVYYEISEDKKIGEIVLLHVKESMRGKGYGKQLLKRAIKELINMKVDEISISVRVTNNKAKKLYERIGFINNETIYAYKKSLK